MVSKPLPMLPALRLPSSWLQVLDWLRPVFARSSTFGLFILLATGLVARTSRRTVVGMLAGVGMGAVVSFHSACRFFSAHRWDVDRLPANAALYGPTPPRTGRRGRPAKKGARLGRLAELAAAASWCSVRVERYARVDTVQVATIRALWYGAFGDTPGRLVLVRDHDTTSGYDLACLGLLGSLARTGCQVRSTPQEETSPHVMVKVDGAAVVDQRGVGGDPRSSAPSTTVVSGWSWVRGKDEFTGPCRGV